MKTVFVMVEMSVNDDADKYELVEFIKGTLDNAPFDLLEDYDIEVEWSNAYFEREEYK